MAIPYTPSQLSLGNFDASQPATMKWLFSSPDGTVIQQSCQIRIYNNTTGALVLDTGFITTTLQQYIIPASTRVNRTEYKWQIRYTDSAGSVSPWSAFQVFTCSSVPVVTVTSPSPSQVLASNVITIAAWYQQVQQVAQQSYRIVLYGSDQNTIVQDSGVIYNTANQYTISGLSNGTYYVQVTMTSADGLQTVSGKVPFTIAYNGPAQSPSIVYTPLPAKASGRIDWAIPTNIFGTYVGPSSGPTYKTGKFNQAIQIASYGEKVYWFLNAPFMQFTYTSWWIPNLASSDMRSNQVIVKLLYDPANYLQIRYDPVSRAFIFEKCIDGQIITAKSVTGLTFSAGAQLFAAIKQNNTTTAYVGINGNFYTINFGVNNTGDANTFGVAKYGAGVYASNVTGIPMLRSCYIGCSEINGNEANALFDQTHLTSQLLSDSAIQALYANTTLQQFTIQSMFLANFDGSLQGGAGNAIPIDHWNVYRSYNGAQKLLGTVTNANQNTGSIIDPIPLSDVSYQYTVVPIDINGNAGIPQMVQGVVSFDGWWITDISTGTSFQLYVMVDDVPIKTNYKRSEYETFGQFPIVAYAPTRYRSGKLSGMIIGTNQPMTAFQQYQALQSLIDLHKPLLLRGDEGWGMMVDCYEPVDTIPHRNHKEWNKVEFSWTEVASL